MRPFVVIRQYETADMIARKDLIKQYAMSFAFDAFTSCLFREVFYILDQIEILSSINMGVLVHLHIIVFFL